jgi:hypothetical protein
MPRAGNDAASYVAHDGGSYRYIQVAQCKTCASPYRSKIEAAWCHGTPPSLILARLPPDHGTSRQSISRHLNGGHAPVDRRIVARRAQVRAEQRWAEVGAACTEFVGTEVEVQALVMRLVAHRLLTGELVLDADAALRAMEMLHRWSWEESEAQRARSAAEERSEVYGAALARLFAAVVEEGGDVLAHQVVCRLRRDVGLVDLLDLPPLQDALRWHCEWINSPDGHDFGYESTA